MTGGLGGMAHLPQSCPVFKGIGFKAGLPSAFAIVPSNDLPVAIPFQVRLGFARMPRSDDCGARQDDGVEDFDFFAELDRGGAVVLAGSFLRRRSPKSRPKIFGLARRSRIRAAAIFLRARFSGHRGPARDGDIMRGPGRPSAGGQRFGRTEANPGHCARRGMEHDRKRSDRNHGQERPPVAQPRRGFAVSRCPSRARRREGGTDRPAHACRP